MVSKTSGSWGVMKINPVIQSLVKEAALLAKQPEYVVLDILIHEGGYKPDLSAERLAGRVQKAITRALIQTRGIDANG